MASMNRCLASLLAACLVNAACAAAPTGSTSTTASAPDSVSEQPSLRLNEILPADIILLGEQHDAAEHQRIHRDVIEALAERGALAAVALEMAPQGGSTAGLPRDATEEAVQAALRWSDASWPWPVYGPAVMAAVRAGVPVLGANLPRSEMRAAMAESQLDALLPGPALKAQQQAIRHGHCDMLPESQIAPMTRIQIARDRAMAQTLAAAVTPGKTVVLLAGGRHVDRGVGVPRHLPPGLRTKVVALRAGAASTPDRRVADADATWTTPPVPPKDYCAGMHRGATSRDSAAGASQERPAQPD
jgi:uncharacterized iron-regulated protein